MAVFIAVHCFGPPDTQLGELSLSVHLRQEACRATGFRHRSLNIHETAMVRCSFAYWVVTNRPSVFFPAPREIRPCSTRYGNNNQADTLTFKAPARVYRRFSAPHIQALTPPPSPTPCTNFLHVILTSSSILLAFCCHHPCQYFLCQRHHHYHHPHENS